MMITKGMAFPLGVTFSQDGINFSVAVDNGKKCELCLYKKSGIEETKKIQLNEQKEFGNIRCIKITGMEDDICEYDYFIDGKHVLDPYVKTVKKDKENNMEHGVIKETPYDWEGDQPLCISDNEVVAYSIHVRGFTMDVSSKVRQKGTFKGVCEKIPYLKELGINQIQCMPVYEFQDGKTYKNYWGYGPASFFAPKASYSASGDPVKELKDTVKECHKNGIEVVLDFPFTGEESYEMIHSCLRYYKLEFHIDGFILNPCNIPLDQMKKDPLFGNTKILKKQDDFQNTMRRFLKGDEGMVQPVMWWLRHISESHDIFNYMTNHTGFTLNDLVSYDKKHNEINGEKNQDGPEYNYSWNCGAEGPSRKKAVTELRKKQIRNAFLLLLTAQGSPCILSGDEFLNSQSGNNNVYCQDNETGWVNWKKSDKAKDQLEFVKKLIKFRKEHPVLHPESELEGIDRCACGVPDISYHGESAWQVPCDVSSRQLGVYYHGESVGDVSCFVAYNMHWLEHDFALPALSKQKKWYLAVSTEEGVLEKERLLKDQRNVSLEERTIAIFIGR